MPCPQSTEYNEAIQNLRSCVSDEELREGQPARNALGLPMAWSGSFADVYKVHCPATGNTWAVKCFTREVPGLRDRYREISTHLEGARLPFMVDFRYVEPGIRIGSQWHAFLKMRWVEGLSLNQFVGDYLESPRTLTQLLGLWLKLSMRLREAEVAHGDLQHGNVLLVPAGERGQLSLKLIDYDGMYVPSLGGRRPGELGHPAYQHPQRFRMGVYNAEVDRFSHLAIYSAVRCLTVGKGELWARFDNGDNLLFREIDFQSPGESEVFHQLWALPDEDAQALVGHLILATQTPLDRVRLLDEVVSDGTVRRLNRDEQRQVKAVLGRGAKQVRAAPQFKRRGIELGAESGVPPLAGTPNVPTRGQATPSTTAPELTPGRHGVAALFGRVIWAGLMPVRGIDQLLGLAVGRDNKILHNFLRAVATCVVVGAALLTGWGMSHVGPPQETPAVEQETVVAEGEPGEAEPEAPTLEQSKRERALAALKAAQDAEQAADAVFQTAVRPASYELGRRFLEDANRAMEEESFDLAEQLSAQATELFAQAQVEAAAANEQGKAEEAWTSALNAADADLLRDYGPQGFADARQEAASAETQAAAGKAKEAAALYRDALATLDRATTVAKDLQERLEAVPPPSAVAPFSAVAAQKYQQGWATHLKTPVDEVNSIGMKFVLIPPGELMMSSPESPEQRRVTISRYFYLGVHEVTQAEYQRVMGTNPSRFRASGVDAPVETVSWEDAEKFCARLSARPEERAAERRYRLPSDAEWEYACRAGTTTRWYFGKEITTLGEHAWFGGNSLSTTHPVGQKKPNPWGLYDMYGNVSEWCADSYSIGPTGSARVIRGGSWNEFPQEWGSAIRLSGSQSHGTPSVGFRVAFDRQPLENVVDMDIPKEEMPIPPEPEPPSPKPSSFKPRPERTRGLPAPQELAARDLTTIDGVQLAATFYPGTKGRDTVPVLLLHMWKGSREDYRGLADYLQEQGHAVLVPDLRGHGGSTRTASGVRELDAARLSADDFRLMLNDMEALRERLAMINDSGELNLNKLCIVGAEMGATVAAYYAFSDWTQTRRERSRAAPSRDVKGLVLISPDRNFHGMPLSKPLSHPLVRSQISTMIVVGKNDSRSSRAADSVHNLLKKHHVDPEKLGPDQRDQIDLFFIEAPTSLQGTKMLGVPALRVEPAIARFIELRLVNRDYPWYQRR